MSREYRFFLEDMQKSCEKVIRFSSGLSREQFFAKEETFDKVPDLKRRLDAILQKV